VRSSEFKLWYCKAKLPSNPTVPLLGMYLKEMKSAYERDERGYLCRTKSLHSTLLALVLSQKHWSSGFLLNDAED
jgi:hypothetical protein